MSKKCIHLYFEGRVQGVGFRYTAAYLANHHNIRGWVMNLPDGRVELLAQGQEEEVERFLDKLKEKFQGYISKIQQKELMLSPDLKRFEIKFHSF